MTTLSEEKILGMPAERGQWALAFLGIAINLCLGTICLWSVFAGSSRNISKERSGSQ